MPLKTLYRWLAYIAIGFITLVIICALAVRFYLSPRSDQYKQPIVNYVAKQLQQPLSVDTLHISWQGLSPELSLHGITLLDKENRAALHLKRVDASLSWMSLVYLSPYLSELAIATPELTIRRSQTGEIFLAGISLNGPSKPEFANWLLKQRRVSINQAKIIWLDELNNTPALELSQLDFTLATPAWRRLIGQHTIDLKFIPNQFQKQTVHISGVMTGNDIDKADQWHGYVHAQLPISTLSHWQTWVKAPLHLNKGQGMVNVTLDFSHLKPTHLLADLNLKGIEVLNQHGKEITAESLAGRVDWKSTNQTHRLQIKNLDAVINKQLELHQANADVSWVQATTNQPLQTTEGQVSLKSFNLGGIEALLSALPLKADWETQLLALSPQGQFKKTRLNWDMQQAQLKHYGLETAFNNLNIRSSAPVPGLNNWNGEITVSEKGGKLSLDTKEAVLDLAGILRWPVPIKQVKGDISWAYQNKDITVKTKNFKVETAHLDTEISATYSHPANGNGLIDLTGKIYKGDAKFAKFYYPSNMGKDTLEWLDNAILSGNISKGDIQIKGRLHDFPYINAQKLPDRTKGIFKVTARVDNADLEYAGKSWPMIKGLGTDMTFESISMHLESDAGDLMGNHITHAKAYIPQLIGDNPMLLINGEVKGNVSDGLKYVNSSPIYHVTEGFTDALKAHGDGLLKLDLKIPLHHSVDTFYQGVYKFNNAKIDASPDIGLPDLSQINGALNINEHGVSANNMHLVVFNNPAVMNLTTGSDKSVMIKASGRINDVNIKKMMPGMITDALQGTSDWKGDIIIKKPLVSLAFTSQLIGMNVSLPPPFKKTSAQAASFKYAMTQQANNQDTIEVAYRDMLQAKILRVKSQGEMQISKGDVGVNLPVQNPSEPGIKIRANATRFNADDWIEYFSNLPTGNNNDAAASSLKTVEVTADDMQIFERIIHHPKLVLHPSQNKIDMQINSQELSGSGTWIQGRQNKLVARLKELHIPDAPLTTGQAKAATDKAYPDLDIVADSFELGQKNLGKLELNATVQSNNWLIQKLKIQNPDSTIVADGVWRNNPQNQVTHLKFDFNSNDLGKTLKRFDHPDTIKGGKARIVGQLSWNGSPHLFSTEHLDGSFKLDAKQGQVLKVQPGVGRLLGLISLQSLPRRLTLDFKDLFSEGFAFDNINGNATINDGVLNSNDFEMSGPAAESQIKGEINLKAETQHLQVKVIPHVSDSLSLAAFAGGPIVGVAAFVAQKILKDPLNKISSTEYTITGTWDNPQELESSKNKEATPTGKGQELLQ